MSTAIEFTVTQTGHGFTGVVPVYFNSGTNLWTLAQANNATTVASHIAVVTGLNTLNIVYAGTITVASHGLSLGYLFTSDAVAGTFSITSGVIANPMVLVTDANTINVLGYPASTTAPFQQLPQAASVNTTNYKELTYWDTGYLVRSVKRLCRLSNAQLPPETDLDIIEIMNEAMMVDVVPLILTYREEYYVESFTFSANDTTKIPLRAIGNKVRSLYQLDGNGNRFRPMQFNDPDTMGFIRYQPFSLWYTINPGVNIANTTLSSPGRNFNIEVVYYRRTNNLEYYDTRSLYLPSGFLDPNSTTPGRKVVSVVGNLVTLEKEHGYLPGQPVDAIEGNAMFERAFGFQILTVPAADQFTYSSTSTLQVGDYVFPDGLTGFPNIPREALMYLVACTSVNLLNSLGSVDEANAMMVYQEKQKQMLTDLLDPRHDGIPHTIVDNRGMFDFT